MANIIEIVIKQTGQGKSISGTIKELGGLDSATSNSIGSLGKFGSALSGLKGAGDAAISALLGVGKALAGVGAIAATALVGFGVSGVKAAMDVDHQLAQIAATLGTTKEAAMPLKQLMTDLALDPKLTVNATQAGQAIEVLAANGLELQDILEGGAKGAVQLANATGSDFATAATIATDAMQQFGFEANQLETVADGIAGVLVKSKFSADDYALALSNAGGIAGSLGVEMTDFNTVLAATSSMFSSGSDAGTSFKTLLTRLANPTDEAAAAMQQYGLNIFDAEGKMKPFAEIAGQLNKVFNESFTVTSQVGGATKEMTKAAEQAGAKIGDLTRDLDLNKRTLKDMQDEYNLQLSYYDAASPKMKDYARSIEKMTNKITDQEEKLAGYQSAISAVDGAQARTITSTQKLTEAQKAELATILGGTDAMRTILGLAGMTEEQFNTLSAEVNKSGLASQAAATRVDSLTGAWEIFKGIIEAVQIQVGDKFLPIIRRVTEAVSVWASENSGQVVDFFGTIADGADSVITSISKIIGAFQRFGIRGAGVSILGQLGMDPKMIGEIKTTISNIISAVTSGFDEIKKAYNIFGAQGAAFTLLKVLGVSPETLIFLDKNLTSIIDTLTEKFNTIKAAFDKFGARGAAFSILGMLGLDSDTMVTLNNAINTVIEAVSSISFDEIIGAFTGVGAVLAGGALAGLVVGVGAAIAGLLTPINLLIAGAALLGMAWAGNWFGIQEVAAQVLANLTTTFETISAVVMSVVNTLMTTAWPQLQQAFANINEALANLGLSWGDIFNALLTSTGIVIGGIVTIIGGLINAVASGIATATEIFASLTSGINQVLTGVIETFVGFGVLIQGILTGNLAQIGQGIMLLAQSMITIISGLAETALAVVSAPFALLLSNITGFVSGAIAMFQGLYDAVVGHSIIPDLVNDVVAWFKKIPQMVVSALGDLGTKVIKPFREMAVTIKEEVGEGFSNFIDDTIPAFVTGFELVIEGVKNFISSIREAGTELADMVIPDFLQRHSPPPLATSFNEIAGGADSAAKAIAGMQKSLLTDRGNALDFVDRLDMGGIAKSHLAGGGEWRQLRNMLKGNIVASMQGLADGTVDILGQITQVATQFNFPPSMAAEFAKTEGLIDHLTGSFATFKKEIAVENLGNMVQMAGQFSSLGDAFSGMLTGQMGSAGEAVKKLTEGTAKLTENNTKLTGELDNQQKQLSIYQQELAGLNAEEEKDALAIEKKVLQIEKLTEAMDKNRATIAANKQELENNKQAWAELATTGDAGLLESLKAFMAGNDQTFRMFKAFEDGTTSEFFWDRNRAQEELNRLLEEQKKREEMITKQKEAQQKLSFLQSQLDLLKLGQGLGGNIFQGITFGLNASVEDLLAATNAVTEAMINQIDQDLQIASPSKVMFNKFKNQVGGAMVSGLAAVKPMLERVAGPMLDPLTGGGASNSKTTNNYFNQTVNTRADSSSVIGDFRTMQLMAGA
jgi:TP901 family phage tail tape measure protein